MSCMPSVFRLNVVMLDMSRCHDYNFCGSVLTVKKPFLGQVRLGQVRLGQVRLGQVDRMFFLRIFGKTQLQFFCFLTSFQISFIIKCFFKLVSLTLIGKNFSGCHDTQHNNTQYNNIHIRNKNKTLSTRALNADYCNAECAYAECHVAVM